MRAMIVLLCLAVASTAVAQDLPSVPEMPEFSSDRPSGVPDTSGWPTSGDFGAGTELTNQSKFTPMFLSVLAPESACTKRTLPCDVVMRFTFWSKGEKSTSLHVGRFIIESPGRSVEAIAVTDREVFSYWVKRAGLWMPLEEGSKLHRAHHEFYEFLQMIQLMSRYGPWPQPKPVLKGKKIVV